MLLSSSGVEEPGPFHLATELTTKPLVSGLVDASHLNGVGPSMEGRDRSHVTTEVVSVEVKVIPEPGFLSHRRLLFLLIQSVVDDGGYRNRKNAEHLLGNLDVPGSP